jgi:demethylmenaquinone methyltransferase/2-methoxy-6-polyprenyl-1,4-benzoquinol methylase
MSWPSTAKDRFVKSASTSLPWPPGERVLEIGYGTGHCLVQLAKPVGPEGKVFGIDLSEGMQAQARARLQKKHLVDRVDRQR